MLYAVWSLRRCGLHHAELVAHRFLPARSLQCHARLLATARQAPSQKKDVSSSGDKGRQPAPLPFSRPDQNYIPPPPAPAPKPFAGILGSSSPTTKSKQGYPERLLIYHAGTARTIFLSSVKLTAIFIFIFTGLLVSPAYYYSPFEPTWMAPVTLAAGALPMVLMTFTSAPFVTYVHLALPTFARSSRARLMRYAQNLPGNSVVDITTLRWIWPRVTRLYASELRIHTNKLGTMTLRREVPKQVEQARQWWQWRPLRRFYVAGKSSKTYEQGVWEAVVGSIAEGVPQRSGVIAEKASAASAGRNRFESSVKR